MGDKATTTATTRETRVSKAAANVVYVTPQPHPGSTYTITPHRPAPRSDKN